MTTSAPSREARTWLDAIGTCLLAIDGAGLITYANDAARALFGAPLVGSLVGVILLHEERPLTVVPSPSDKGPTTLDCRLARDGARVQVDIQRRHDPDGAPASVLAVHTTSAEHQREIRKFERLAAMGTMVAGFAHEVLNPVASLRSLTESLDEELAEGGLRMPHIGRMLRVLERMERLVRTSLQFGRPVPPRRAKHRPWTLLSSALMLIGPRTRAMGQEIRIEVDPDLPDVWVDDAQISQVLVIFLNNALDATLAPRKVLMRACRMGDDIALGAPPTLRFDVENEGPGISREDLPRIFDPFFTTKASGTGLGLPIAQQLVNENGARLEVTTAPEGPTRFSVVLPTA